MIPADFGMRVAVVALGGAAGSVARYLVNVMAAGLLGTAFPWGTLVVNVVGSALLGGLMGFGQARAVHQTVLWAALTTGVMGGFTTYSSFNWETLKLWEEGATGLAMVNLAGTVLLCLLGGLAGLAVGRWLAA